MLQGHEVIVADNFFTGRKRNIEHWIGHENFELINHDIVNPLFIEGTKKTKPQKFFFTFKFLI
jgi:UDP-glucuronate decarboxylase